MSERERNYAYEALAEVTDADMDASRGELNIALKTIKQQSPIEDSYLLAAEIHDQARRYRAVMGDDVLLTPNALAKHWKRVSAESLRQKGGTNLVAHKSDECATCDGDRMVVVAVRAPTQSRWMRERDLEAVEHELLDEYAPCPSCGPDEVKMRRFDGTVIRTPDRARTRELMDR